MFELADLPSGTSAKALVQGDMGALPEVVLHTVLRAGLIGTGMYIAGARTDVARNAVAGSLAIEVFVLLWTLREASK